MTTFRQKVLRIFYPLVRKMGKKGKKGTVLVNEQHIAPVESFYRLRTSLNNGKEIDFAEFSGKKVVIVNTASNCGYTGQYAELQSLHEKFGDTLRIIGFPANDFKEQEQAGDADIAQFCQVNYGVTFPLSQKAVVVKGDKQQPVFKWLTHAKANGWNNQEPDWNFSKYVVDEKGNLTHYFGPAISPLDDVFLKAIQ